MVQSPFTGVTPPKPIDVSLCQTNAEHWRLWKQQWGDYSTVTELDQRPENYQIALLRSVIGTEALKVYNTMTFTAAAPETVARILEKFEALMIGELNETFERYVFNSFRQGEHESFDQFYTELLRLSKTCGFCDCLRDTLVRDRVVIGIRDSQVRKKLLQTRQLTLANCVNICKAAEMAEHHLQGIKSPDSVHYVDTRRNNSQRSSRPSRSKSRPRQGGQDSSGGQGRRGGGGTRSSGGNLVQDCRFCGREHERAKEACAAWGKTCAACKGKNHFAVKCPSSSSKSSSKSTTSHRSSKSSSSRRVAALDTELWK